MEIKVGPNQISEEVMSVILEKLEKKRIEVLNSKHRGVILKEVCSSGRPTIIFDALGNFKGTFNLLKEIDEKLGISKSLAIACLDGTINHAKGYIIRELYKSETYKGSDNEIDISELKFNKLTILSETPFKLEGQWYVTTKCDCGNIKDFPVTNIINNKLKGCGCVRGTTGNSRKYNAEDFVGMVIGKYTIISSREIKTQRSNGKLDTKYLVTAECKDCGTISEMHYSHLQQKKGLTCKNCVEGGRREVSLGHIGEKFGRLTIVDTIKKNGSNGKLNYFYVCKCDCGSDKEVVNVYAELASSYGTKSCGCLSTEKFIEMLKEHRPKVNWEYGWSIEKDGKMIIMRSGYEVLYSNFLMYKGIDFSYERDTFTNQGSKYTPDFYLPLEDKYIEIKGEYRENSNQPAFRDVLEKEGKLLVLYWEDLKKMFMEEFGLNRFDYKHVFYKAKRYDRGPNDYFNTFISNKLYLDPYYNIIDTKTGVINSEDFSNSNEFINGLFDIIKTEGVQWFLTNSYSKDPIKSLIDLKEFDTSRLLLEADAITKREYINRVDKNYVQPVKVGNDFVDHFTKEIRLKCPTINGPSLYSNLTNREFFNKIGKKVFLQYRGVIKKENILSTVRLNSQIPSNFKPAIAKFIMDHFGSKKVLDFSSGWGDRLAGALCSESVAKYTGIDPNTSLIDPYKQMIDLHNLYFPKKDITMICSPAEDISFDEGYDLVFTSPPYYNVEKYSYEETQSWVRYKNLEDWMSGFLLPVLEKGYNSLEPSGKMVINIADVYSRHRWNLICDPMNSFLEGLGMKYKGTLNYKLTTKPFSKFKGKCIVEPMWVWEK